MKKVGKNCNHQYLAVGGKHRCKVDPRRHTCPGNKECFHRPLFEPNDLYLFRLKKANPDIVAKYKGGASGPKTAEKPVKVGDLAEKAPIEKPKISRIKPDKGKKPVSGKGGNTPDSDGEAVSTVSLSQGRCEAIKGNGEQCKNDAVPGKNYCGVTAHKKQMKKKNRKK